MITAVAAGLLALLHAADLVQGLLGLPYTVHDLWRMMGGAGASDGGFTVQSPWNLGQTAVLLLLSIVALLGGLICLGRRRGAARAGGVFAVLAVVLPLTLPLLVLPLSQTMSGASQGASWESTLLLTGLPSLASASGLVPGLVAAILLAAARSPGLQASGLGLSVVGMVLGAVVALESLAALIRHATALTGWWGVGWSGVVGVGPSVALVLSLLLVVVMAAAGLGSGLLLGSTSLLTRIGGGLLAAALVVRVATQVVTWGMGYYLQVWAAQMFDYSWIGLIDWTHAIVVPLLAVPGVLLAIIGLFTGLRRVPTAAGPSAPGGATTSGGSAAV